MKSPHANVTRIESAKVLFYRFIDSLKKDKNMLFALRMYGNTVPYPPGDCKDTRLVVPFSQGNVQAIKQKVSEAKPTGITPIEHSLTESANDFPDNKATNMVILITDGIEECGGDPCRARQKLMEKGIVFKPFIIGIGLSPEQIKTFQCVGDYYDIDSQNTFSTITTIIQQQKLNKTTAQVSLFDINSNPSESNVNITLYDVSKKTYKYNFIHTFNYLKRPDTLYIDDYPNYKAIAHTIPPVENNEFKLVQGKHTIVPIDAPQGFLTITRPVGVYNYNEKIKCVIRKNNSPGTLHVLQINALDKFIVGAYDIEILTLPRIYLNNISVEQSKTNQLTIASAGMLQVKTLEAGDGCIMQEKNNRLEWVCNLSQQTIQSFNLQPGNYVVTWRSKTLRGSIYTIEKKLKIKSDEQMIIEMFK